jgi:hypothetical protein
MGGSEAGLDLERSQPHLFAAGRWSRARQPESAPELEIRGPADLEMRETTSRLQDVAHLSLQSRGRHRSIMGLEAAP